MPDDPKLVGPQDGKLISLTEPHEREYWTRALNITPDRLREAVENAGHSAERVREWLDQQPEIEDPQEP